MRNTLTETETLFLEDYLEISECYFEYGSGATTLIANKYLNLKSIFSITSEKDVYDEVLNQISGPKIRLFYKDINSGKMGHPIDSSKKAEWPNYAKAIDLYTEPHEKWDLILINGRFRVASAAACFNKITENGYLIMCDFNREAYSPIKILYNKIKTVGRMALFQKKDVGLDLFNKYQYVTM